MTIEDFKFLHFAVIIFRFKTDACKNQYIIPEKGRLSANKQYWALITQVCEPDEIHTKPAIYVAFIGDDNRQHDLWIPIELFNDRDITIYPFRTPDEKISYTGFLADKVVERLENFVVPYTKHPNAIDDYRYQSAQDRNQDIEVIKQVCGEEGLCDLAMDKVESEWIHWRKEKHYYRVHIYYKSGDRYDFNVYVGKNVINENKERQETLKKEIEELSKTIADETMVLGFSFENTPHEWKMVDHLKELRDIKERELKELEEADHG